MDRHGSRLVINWQLSFVTCWHLKRSFPWLFSERSTTRDLSHLIKPYHFHHFSPRFTNCCDRSGLETGQAAALCPGWVRQVLGQDRHAKGQNFPAVQIAGPTCPAVKAGKERSRSFPAKPLLLVRLDILRLQWQWMKGAWRWILKCLMWNRMCSPSSWNLQRRSRPADNGKECYLLVARARFKSAETKGTIAWNTSLWQCCSLQLYGSDGNLAHSRQEGSFFVW